LYAYTQRSTYKNTGTGPVKYLQDEKMLTMFADYNKFGEFTRILADRLNLKCLGNLT